VPEQESDKESEESNEDSEESNVYMPKEDNGLELDMENDS
jgi:hypothetical protein